MTAVTSSQSANLEYLPSKEYLASFDALTGRAEEILGTETAILLEVAYLALVTQFDRDRLIDAMKRARAVGIAREDLHDVLDVMGTVGMAGITAGAPIFKTLLTNRGELKDEPGLPGEKQRVRKLLDANRPRFGPDVPLDGRGGWLPAPASFEAALEIDPVFCELMFNVFDRGLRLEPRLFVLLCIVTSAAASHINLVGIEYRVNMALDVGVSHEEVMAVLALAAELGRRNLEDGYAAIDAAFDDRAGA